MTTRFLAPDLTQLEPADLIEVVDFEDILAAQKAWVLATWANIRITRPDLPPLDTLGLETEPMNIILQSTSYRETLLRALVNDKARAVMLAYATGHDLDHLGALFGTIRMTITAATDTSPAIMESDERFRRRIQLAPEAFSCAGPQGAYIYFALTEDISIADAYAFTPDPTKADGRVDVIVAGTHGADVSDDVITALIERFAREDTVPLTDVVVVRRAQRVDYKVAGTLYIPRGPDPDTIQTAAETAIESYAAERCKIHTDVFHSGITKAGKVGGVEDFLVSLPAQNASISIDEDQISNITDIDITVSVEE